jgi:hypothetical protein
VALVKLESSRAETTAEVFLPKAAFAFKEYWAPSNAINLVALGTQKCSPTENLVLFFLPTDSQVLFLFVGSNCCMTR